ncbi:hypothetical protein F4777DRAFT_589898 [Nemania sp. FL0916]|nr:hypothetical protein F4777DRAFT_589898 [Nemania sp. FL0916]
MSGQHDQPSRTRLESRSSVPDVEDIPLNGLVPANLPRRESLQLTPYSGQVSTIVTAVLEQENTASSRPQTVHTVSDPSHSHDNKAHKKPTMFRYILECCISSIIAVVIFTANSNGMHLSDWESEMSPNTIISALATLAKTFIQPVLAEGINQAKWLYWWKIQRPLSNLSIYDDASRGPWGSLKFLRLGWRRKPPVTACIGAIITILSLAMGPFLQQLVVYKTVMIPQPGAKSTIPLTNTYIIKDYDGFYGSEGSLNHRTLQGALTDGLFNEKAPLQFTCQSGNCTWREFTTLGVCSSCTDVSTTPLAATTVPFVGSNNSNNVRFTLSTPSGFQFVYNPLPVQEKWWSPIFYQNKLVYENHYILAQSIVDSQVRSLINKTSNASILSTAIVQQGYSVFAREMHIDINFPTRKILEEVITAAEANATVTECTMSWCARTYQNFTAVCFSAFHIFCIRHLIKLLFRSKENKGSTNYHYRHSRTSEFYIAYPDDPLDRGKKRIFPFNNSIFTVPVEVPPIISTLIETALHRSSDFNSITGFALRHGNNISERMDVLSDSLTRWLQSSGSSIELDGDVLVESTIISIHWQWLTLPVIIIVLIIAFLAAILKESHDKRVPMWKSSQMPLVFHGIKDWTADELRNIQEGRLEMTKHMDEKAELMKVKLIREDGGAARLARDEEDEA